MKEIKCEVIRDLLPLYVDDAASKETRELIQEHLNTCPDCREELQRISVPVSLPPDEDTQLLERFNHKRREKRRRKRKLGLVCAILILIPCLWYTHVPRSWADISRAGQIKSLYGYYGYTEEVSYINDDPNQGGITTVSQYLIQDMDSSHPAAQVIISALEGRTYRAGLGNLRPGLFLPDRISVDGADHLSFYLRTQNRGPMLISIYSNGLFTIGGLTSMTPQGLLSYKTDTDLYQEVFEIVQEYSTYDQYQWQWQGVIEPH